MRHVISSATPRVGAVARPVLVAVAIGLLAGCAYKPDSVTVGAVPDDYRTNHPIVVSEQEQVLDVPVGAGDRGMTVGQRATIEGYLSTYDIAAAQPLTILVPSGSANEVAAGRAAEDFTRFAKQNGVPGNRIQIARYNAAGGASAPVRLSYAAIRAQTNKCGRWPEDLADNAENKHYANFGCSYQNNLAAQIANPNDLLGPRKQSPMDAEKNGEVIRQYRERGVWPEFVLNSEVVY